MVNFFKETSVTQEEANPILVEKESAPMVQSDKMFKVFSRPQIEMDDILKFDETRHGVEKLMSEGLNVSWVESQKKHVFSEQDYPVIRKWVKNQMSSLNSRTSLRS
jgi:tRNA uridine 5-carboxymethylaminomethyl modification enzyme